MAQGKAQSKQQRTRLAPSQRDAASDASSRTRSGIHTTRRRIGAGRPAGPTGHGQITRQQLLEVAGQAFADKGVDRATGKEICARAKTNPAAINYHFGGFVGLYEAVLCEAHHRLATVESIQAAAADAPDAQAKLAAVIGLIVAALAGPVSSSWVLRVLGREIMAPTPAFEVLREREVLPKLHVIRQIVAQLLNLPDDHPAVARSCHSIMAPCAMLIIGERRMLKKIFPGFDLTPQTAPALAQHMVRFCCAGLSAIAQDAPH